MLLKGGYIVNSDRKFQADIFIEKNIIKQIGQNIVLGSDIKIIDVTNKIIIPGGIDPSTNFNVSSNKKDVLQNESIVALAGGTTTIMTRVKETNGNNLVDSIKTLQTQMKSTLFCNYVFYPEINPNNDDSVKHMETLARNHGINSFQMTIGNQITPNIISILKKCKELQCLLRLHVEDKSYTNVIAEELLKKGISGPEGFFQSRCLENELESIYKILKLNYAFPCCLIVPDVMNEDVAKIIAQMKKEGRPIFSETITAALTLSSGRYFSSNWEEAASIITDPPLRHDQHSSLIRSIHSGDIDMLASQHTTITNADRSVGKKDFRDIPQGLMGAEERLAILWDRGVKTGIINECEFVAATSTNAAKIFNMYPERGHIAVGSYADLVIWNPDKTNSISESGHLKTDANIFEGISCHGSPDIVIINGIIKYQKNEIVGSATGEKLELKINCKMLADKLVRFETIREFGKMSIKREWDETVNTTVYTSVNYNAKETNAIENHDSATKELNPLKMQRPLTSGGNRNMQDSSFSLSGSQIDDEKPIRSTIRTNHPPGGKSSLIF